MSSLRSRRERFTGWVHGEGRSERLVGTAALVWTGVGVLVLAYVAWRLAWPVLSVVGPPLLVAALIVYALEPAVGALARRRVPRVLATFLVHLVVLGALGGLVVVVAPLVGAQLGTLVEEAPELRGRARELVQRGAGAMGVELTLPQGADGGQIVEEVADETGAALQDEVSRQRLLGALGGLAGMAAGTARLLLLLLIGPVLAFYLLADLSRVTTAFRRLVPPGGRDETFALLASVGRVTGGYVRGQLVVALFVGVAATIGYWLIGLPFWALVGIVAGLSNLVPFIGPIVGGLLGVAVALLGDGLGLAVWVVVVTVVVQQLESQVISPLVMGRTVKVHPLLVILAVLVGGALFGLPGLLLAVPAIAAAKVVALHLWHRHIPWAEGTPPEDPREVEGAAIEPIVGGDG